jgi:hypothetical protein
MSSTARNFAIFAAGVILLVGIMIGHKSKKCEACPQADYSKVDSLTQVSAQMQAQNAILTGEIEALKDSLNRVPVRKPTKQRIEHEDRAFRSAGLDSAALYLLSEPQ